jgi:hypothetical protein
MVFMILFKVQNRLQVFQIVRIFAIALQARWLEDGPNMKHCFHLKKEEENSVF